MDEAHIKARETRQRNLEARLVKLQAEIQAINAARAALKAILERKDATTAEILEATKLLISINKLSH